MRYILPIFLIMVMTASYANLANASKLEKASPKAEAPYKVITAEELKAMQEKSSSLLVIDSRGGKHFDGEMIKGAVNLPVKETNAESLAKLASDKKTDIVFYCTNTECPASKLAAYKVHAAGYTSLYKYPGGIEDWKSKGFPTVKSDKAVKADK